MVELLDHINCNSMDGKPPLHGVETIKEGRWEAPADLYVVDFDRVYRKKPKVECITVNGRKVPKPITRLPDNEFDSLYIADPTAVGLVSYVPDTCGVDDRLDSLLALGIVHTTYAAARQHAEAWLDISDEG